jgi:hypothetical protein
VPGATAKVKIGGKISSANTLDLRFATVTVSALLREQGDELARAGGGSPLLPLALRPRPGAKPTAAVFETASGARPSVQVEIKQRDPKGGELEFSVTVDRASIPRAPRGCALGGGNSVQLSTGLVIDDSVRKAVEVNPDLPWRCGKSNLRSP